MPEAGSTAAGTAGGEVKHRMELRGMLAPWVVDRVVAALAEEQGGPFSVRAPCALELIKDHTQIASVQAHICIEDMHCCNDVLILPQNVKLHNCQYRAHVHLVHAWNMHVGHSPPCNGHTYGPARLSTSHCQCHRWD